ncbi:cytochrome b [Tabrizicola sp.]|uniref:cytochrome b n=1 Tax=Tabrizicola sp. TaxID=2005166 RepID=UPI002736EF0E|nr:cytochrome b/b6 domain-containing protein [Tabrizicola sp.]MDP3195029.1 cytochrome b/b6 domain-containing protein [Tabrizicola sp.]
MALRNGPDAFGLVTRVIHWTMMLLVIAQLSLGLRISDMEPGLSNLWLYGLHKTIGFAVLALILARIAWHIVSPPPLPFGPRNAAFWAARAAHWAIYALLIAIPLTGWAGSSATGIDVMIADRWTVPPLVDASEVGEAFWFRLHDSLTKVFIGLLTIHMLAAFKREMEGDGTLTRMIRGKA